MAEKVMWVEGELDWWVFEVRMLRGRDEHWELTLGAANQEQACDLARSYAGPGNVVLSVQTLCHLTVVPAEWLARSNLPALVLDRVPHEALIQDCELVRA